MKALPSVLVATLVIESALLPYGAYADIAYDATKSTLQGQVECHKVGNLLLAEGVALLSAEAITIEAKDSVTGHSAPVLQGQLFNVTTSEAGLNATYRGYAYFKDGSKLSLIETACNHERVDLKDGSHVVGPITNVTPSSLTVGAQQVAIASIAGVHSPRVYEFKANQETSGKAKISFSPTCQVAHEFHMDRKRAIIIALVVAGVATGIACGVAIPLSVHHHHHVAPTIQPTQTVTATVITKLPVTQPPKIVYIPPKIFNPLHGKLIPPGITGKPTHPYTPPPPPPPPPPPRRGRGFFGP